MRLNSSVRRIDEVRKYLCWLIDVVVTIAIWRMGWLDTFDLFMFASVLATIQIYYLVRDWRLRRYGEEIQRRMQQGVK